MLEIVINSLIIIMFFLLIAWYIKKPIIIKNAAMVMVLWQIMLLSGMVWLNEAGESIVPFLRLNFYIILGLGLGLFFLWGVPYVLKQVNFNENDYDEDKKYTK